MKKFDVALFGSVFVDHVFTGLARWPRPGEEVFADAYQREIGGGCFNTACGLAKLGATASCFATIGKDDSGWLLARIRSFGVEINGVQFSNQTTGVTMAVSLQGERTFFTCDGANRDLARWLESPNLPEKLALARHVHFAYPLPPAIGLRVVRALHGHGATVSLDPGWNEDWLSDEESWSLLAEVDWFLPNESEAALLTGKSEPEEILRAFASRGVRRAVVKLGPRGAATWSARKMICVPALPVTVVDTTGAGDAFDAGFLHAQLAGLPEEVCLERGVICGSLSTRQAGSLNAFPNLKEVLDYHEQYSKR